MSLLGSKSSTCYDSYLQLRATPELVHAALQSFNDPSAEAGDEEGEDEVQEQGDEDQEESQAKQRVVRSLCLECQRVLLTLSDAFLEAFADRFTMGNGFDQVLWAVVGGCSFAYGL